MSVNFNGGNLPKSAQGFGGVKPNANPTVNNEDIAVNGGELNAADNIQPEGTTTRTKVYVWDDKSGKYNLQGDYPDDDPNGIILVKGDHVMTSSDTPMSPFFMQSILDSTNDDTIYFE